MCGYSVGVSYEQSLCSGSWGSCAQCHQSSGGYRQSMCVSGWWYRYWLILITTTRWQRDQGENSKQKYYSNSKEIVWWCFSCAHKIDGSVQNCSIIALAMVIIPIANAMIPQFCITTVLHWVMKMTCLHLMRPRPHTITLVDGRCTNGSPHAVLSSLIFTPDWHIACSLMAPGWMAECRVLWRMGAFLIDKWLSIHVDLACHPLHGIRDIGSSKSLDSDSV